ncbi:hypothetical protein KF840_17865 [bacterium]|nr:hypothetical protein [bacterium]
MIATVAAGAATARRIDGPVATPIHLPFGVLSLVASARTPSRSPGEQQAGRVRPPCWQHLIAGTSQQEAAAQGASSGCAPSSIATSQMART